MNLLDRLTENQWEYYLNECLQGDVLILQKLAWYDKTQTKWLELVNEFSLNSRAIKSQEITKLLLAKNKSILEREAIKLLTKIDK